MRRLVIAGFILAAAGVSVVGTVYLFGCCVLPFHRVLHRIVPLCSIAAMLSPAKASPQPAEPAPEPQKRASWSATLERIIKVSVPSEPAILAPAAASLVAHRNVITLGAVRCDEDVGLNLLNETFRI